MKITDIIKYMGYYIEAKDKVLWEGSQSSGTISTPGISDYDEIEVINTLGRGMLCRKSNDGKTWIGGAVFGRFSSGGHITAEIAMIQNGNNLTFESNYCTYLSHIYGSTHTTRNTEIYQIAKIIGKEPKKSAIMDKITTGGGTKFRSIPTFRGWSIC